MSQTLSGRSADLPPPIIHEFAPVARQLLASDARIELLTGQQGTSIKAAIEEQLGTLAPRVLSFDVFDTFLLRNDKAEAERYLELSQLLRARVAAAVAPPSHKIPSDLDFLSARVDALKLSYRMRPAVEGCREGHIEQVIRIARRSLGLAGEMDRLLLETELDFEAANVSINPILLDIAAAFRADGGKVILVSDMYFGRKEIEEILRRTDERALKAVDRIFSSADHAVSKRSGKMFGFIERSFDLPPSAFLHIGDAWEGDVQRCREAGWTALHFPVSRSEAMRRQESLSRFCADMDRLGHDATWWAKV